MAGIDYTALISTGGKNFSAWKSVVVRREWHNLVSTFQFSAAEGAYGPGYSGLQIAPGDVVDITLAGKMALHGWVKIRSVTLDKEGHTVVIAGESVTADLARSSVAVQPGTYNGSTFEQAANAVMAPHGITLKMLNPPPIVSKPFKSLVPQYGEVVGEFLARTAMMRGLFLTDDENGNVVAGQIDDAAGPVAELQEGVNIERIIAHLEDPSASAAAKLLGVGQNVGDDNSYPSRANAAVATNSEVRQNTFRLFLAEHPADPDELQARVDHEAATSLWPQVNVTVTVPGWLRPDGELWDLQKKISVISPSVFPNTSGAVVLGTQSVTFMQDDQGGTTTTLELVRSDSLTVVPTANSKDLGPPAIDAPAQPQNPN